jgi:hypothetical protein
MYLLLVIHAIADGRHIKHGHPAVGKYCSERCYVALLDLRLAQRCAYHISHAPCFSSLPKWPYLVPRLMCLSLVIHQYSPRNV